MRVPLSWLREYVDVDLSRQLADAAEQRLQLALATEQGRLERVERRR